jgi:HlyD family secretion protein
VAQNELTEALASLRIEHEAPPPRAAAPRRWPALAAAAAVLAGVAAWGILKPQRAGGARAFSVARPEVAGEGGAAVVAPLSASGWIVASREAVLSPANAGRVVEFRPAEGAAVRAGEVIARLDDREAVAELERARAALTRARAEAGERRRLVAVSERLALAGALADSDLDASRSRLALADADVGVARAEVAAAEAAVEACVIRSPFDGVLARRLVEPGESVAPTAVPRDSGAVAGAVATVADLSVLEVQADVNEMHLERVHVGQLAEVEVSARPGKRYAAEVVRVMPVADRAKGAVAVRARLRERDDALRPQLSARISFLSGTPRDAAVERVILVPRSVLAGEGGSRVYAVRDGRALALTVALGDARGDRVQVRGGLVGDEVLIANPPPDLADGERVEVQP